MVEKTRFSWQRLHFKCPRRKLLHSFTRNWTPDRSSHNSSAQPLLEVFLDKLIIGEVRIIAADTIDFLGLPGREHFVRVETPGAFEQSLAPQHLVNSRNAAGKMV